MKIKSQSWVLEFQGKVNIFPSISRVVKLEITAFYGPKCSLSCVNNSNEPIKKKCCHQDKLGVSIENMKWSWTRVKTGVCILWMFYLESGQWNRMIRSMEDWKKWSINQESRRIQINITPHLLNKSISYLKKLNRDACR